jgi:hemoglobin-like flavoprotein
MGGAVVDDRESLRTAKASFDRCSATPDFLAGFYDNFFAACPDAKPLFAKTDFARQTRLLRDAIGLLLIAPFFSTGADAGPTVLSKMAERHSRRHLNIEPRFYPPFVEALITTVREFDPEFSPDVEAAWRAAISTGVAYMQSHY